MKRKSLLSAILLSTSCATSAWTQQADSRAATDAERALFAGDYSKALELAERGLEEHPSEPWLLYDRGTALAAVGRLEDALDTLRAAEAAFPARETYGRAAAIYRRALALEIAGRCAEASTELSHYAAVERPRDPSLAEEARSHLRYCFPGTELQERLHREKVALDKTWEDPMRADVEDASTRAVFALTRGDYAKAKQHTLEGLTLAPDDPWLNYNHGVALAGEGRTDEALRFLHQAERHFAPNNVHGRGVTVYRRALLFEATGQCELAAAEYRRFASLSGEPEAETHAAAHVKFCRAAASRGSL
jgi:tetratricopeptide (TPR) repeat protein